MHLRDLIHSQIDRLDPQQLARLEQILELMAVQQQQPIKDAAPWRRARAITSAQQGGRMAQEIIDARADRI